MKNILFTLLLVVSTLFSQAGREPMEINSKIERVTVFLRGAQIYRTAKKNLDPGTHYLKITDLSPLIDPNSIQVKGKGKVTILSVTHEQNYLKGADRPKIIENLTDTLKSLELDLKFNQNQQLVYKEEKAMILTNKQVGWKNSDFNIEDLEDLADFYRVRLEDILLKILQLQEKEKMMKDKQQRIKRQLSQQMNLWQKSTSEITVELSANQKTAADLTVSYFISGAGWIPTYDVRAENVTDPVNMKYNARVFQSSGIDWEDVQLSLSTGNPNLSGNKPELGTWSLYIQSESYDKKRKQDNQLQYFANSAYELEEADEEGGGGGSIGVYKEALDAGYYTDVRPGQINVSFKIKIPYTIPSDGKRHLVNVDNFKLPATYQYYCAPKVETDAFLIANATGWDAFNLLPGTANIYFEDTYVGQSYIDPNAANDTLELSLGRDKGVSVSRKKIKDFTSTKVIGSKKQQTYGIEITIRNSKSTPIDLVLEDQIPVSSDRSIEVNLEESSGASLKESSGALMWNLSLPPASGKNVKFRYSVKYPKDKSINL